jgi:hypothetical protein
MQKNDTNDFVRKKHEARKKYAERQIDKWVAWSFANKGKVIYKELLEVIEQYNNAK